MTALTRWNTRNPNGSGKGSGITGLTSSGLDPIVNLAVDVGASQADGTRQIDVDSAPRYACTLALTHCRNGSALMPCTSSC